MDFFTNRFLLVLLGTNKRGMSYYYSDLAYGMAKH